VSVYLHIINSFSAYRETDLNSTVQPATICSHLCTGNDVPRVMGLVANLLQYINVEKLMSANLVLRTTNMTLVKTQISKISDRGILPREL
jgi:hypothetical protein